MNPNGTPARLVAAAIIISTTLAVGWEGKRTGAEGDPTSWRTIARVSVASDGTEANPESCHLTYWWITAC
jgi:hypothetical protein